MKRDTCVPTQSCVKSRGITGVCGGQVQKNGRLQRKPTGSTLFCYSRAAPREKEIKARAETPPKAGAVCTFCVVCTYTLGKSPATDQGYSLQHRGRFLCTQGCSVKRRHTGRSERKVGHGFVYLRRNEGVCSFSPSSPAS